MREMWFLPPGSLQSVRREADCTRAQGGPYGEASLGGPHAKSRGWEEGPSLKQSSWRG